MWEGEEKGAPGGSGPILGTLAQVGSYSALWDLSHIINVLMTDTGLLVCLLS